MFQIASHPSSFNSMHSHGHGHSQSHAHQNAQYSRSYASSSFSFPPNIQLPRRLSRPAFTELSREAIVSSYPELREVPAEYIKNGMRPKAEQMMKGISALMSADLPSTLPRCRVVQDTFRLSVREPLNPAHQVSAAYIPNCVLAVSKAPPPSSRNAPASYGPMDPVHFFPMHSAILALNCSILPTRTLPRMYSHTDRTPSKVELPLIHLSLPSITHFRDLHSYMYTGSLSLIFFSLLPIPPSVLGLHPSVSPTSKHYSPLYPHPKTGARHPSELSRTMVRTALGSPDTLYQLSSHLYQLAFGNGGMGIPGVIGGGVKGLLNQTAVVKDMWQDVVALGMNDPDLWDVLDLAWEVVLGALNLGFAAEQAQSM
ncbi:hypothetical protein D9613_010965 [Agrocybe pediades]|uniref:Uncharacterized protein n=1 Tax=Agrocybe pediades TaxID=84607 RepID=A0A8H4QLP6_9AGAR|nr:hypothetical protein D9613_010965 [Agrocybe pediades]